MMPGIVVIELPEVCRYCNAERGTEMCGNCKRSLCNPCRVGLGCLKSPPRCHARPNGTGVW